MHYSIIAYSTFTYFLAIKQIKMIEAFTNFLNFFHTAIYYPSATPVNKHNAMLLNVWK